ncbi:MAG: hypothetical protein Q9209_004871 [Squamulea sp. 1 TL-2023]
MGDQLIHIRPGSSSGKGSMAFSHVICSAKTSEDTAYTRSVLGYQIIPEGQIPDCYVESCRSRHNDCSDVRGDPRTKLSLSLLSTSRQTYEEGTYILWATNTFAFDHAATFQEFMSTLSFDQRSKLTRLHFTHHWYASSMLPWEKAITPVFLRSFRGLKSIQLCLENTEMPDLWLPYRDARSLDSQLTAFLRFQQCALTKAQVTFANCDDNFSEILQHERDQCDALDRHPQYGKSRFTWLEKRKIACYYEVRLLCDSIHVDVVTERSHRLEAEQKARDDREQQARRRISTE